MAQQAFEVCKYIARKEGTDIIHVVYYNFGINFTTDMAIHRKFQICKSTAIRTNVSLTVHGNKVAAANMYVVEHKTIMVFLSFEL